METAFFKGHPRAPRVRSNPSIGVIHIVKEYHTRLLGPAIHGAPSPARAGMAVGNEYHRCWVTSARCLKSLNSRAPRPEAGRIEPHPARLDSKPGSCWRTVQAACRAARAPHKVS